MKGLQMNDYHLHELGGDRFEELVIKLCRDVLGIGTIAFATGPDGGRDGRFTGRAQRYPSAASPWEGKFIIQAKWTASPVASCSDSEFKTKVVNKELPRIEALQKNGELEKYMMFTNRKMPAACQTTEEGRIATAASTKDVAIIGIETLSQLLDGNRELVREMNLHVHTSPLRIRSEDIREVIQAFAQSGFQFSTVASSADSLVYINLDKKNVKNNLTTPYFNYIEA
ncbi:MAG TPA: hypothetical protein PKA27_07070, partial [Fimbriimonadaceae bacterium]|nr:hypothetical protein [Fimbriimonadaceae bacterium]